MEKCYLFHQIDVWQNGTELLEDERDTELVERGAKREGGEREMDEGEALESLPHYHFEDLGQAAFTVSGLLCFGRL